MPTIHEIKAKRMTGEELNYAITDVKNTLNLWKDSPLTDPYVVKLWAEWDAYTVEFYRRKHKALKQAKKLEARAR